ncbi:MAG TPA: Uma2 family endonuclease [Thermoanaerobaculia bacterium]|nr:Uma2 family endonuclease [Thermoanaerobaculia bacterium]
MQTMPESRLKLTIEDYELFPDDGRRHELVDGEHVVTPSPNLRHQLVVGALYVALREVVSAKGLGTVVLAPMDVTLSPNDVVQPDLLLVSNERRGLLAARVDGPPDLVIEVASPTSRRTDELLKRRAYERFGVDELWIVDPDLEVVRIYRREGEGFARPLELSAERGDSVETPLLPGLRLQVAAIFAED